MFTIIITTTAVRLLSQLLVSHAKKFQPFSTDIAKNGKPKVVIFYGSVRNGRIVERVGKYVETIAQSQNIEPVIFDPLKMQFELLKQPIHFYPNPKDAPAWLREANEEIKAADGYILLCPEYNCLPAPALLNMISHFPKTSFIHKPAALITYSVGNFAGCRACTIIKPFVNELGMVLIPSFVPIPAVNEAFKDDNNKCSNELVIKNVKHTVEELQWYVQGLKKLRAEKKPPQAP